MTMPSITVLTQLDPLTYRAICELLPQLTASSRLPTYSELSEIVDAPCTRLLVARDGDQLLGMLTLVLVRLPSACVAHVEDVVVDEVSRGKGSRPAPFRRVPHACNGGGRDARRSDIATRPHSSERSLPVARVRTARDQCLPIRDQG